VLTGDSGFRMAVF